LEHLDFQAPEQIDRVVRQKLATHGLKGNGLHEALCAQLQVLLQAPLVTPLEPSLTLSRISPAERLSEVEFSHPITSLQEDQLQEIFVKHGGLALPVEFPKSLGRLHFRPVEGFMRGFIDLLFRFQSRYYIVDWKSNWLGNRLSDYDETGIQGSMLQHSYFLQYHLYTVAADLYLRRRVSGYEVVLKRLAYKACNQLQKSHPDFNRSQQTALYQAFRLHRGGIASILFFAVSRWAQHSKIPALLIFDRRRAIGIEHISLVQHGFRDLPHRREIHQLTVSSTGITRSNVSSHVGIPCRTLY